MRTILHKNIVRIRSLFAIIKKPLNFKNKYMDIDILDLSIRKHTGLIPISDVSGEDVFIVGFPKSGNTWFQNIISGVIYRIDPEFVPDTVVQDLVPDIHQKFYYKRYRTPMFFKSHHLPQAEYKHVVYLLRDGRDAMTSYFNFVRARYDKNIDFLKLIQTGASWKDCSYCKWHEHVEAWLSNPYNAQMIIIKYEDLISNPVRELRRFCAFVGEDRDDSQLEMVAKKTSFEKMRQKEIRQKWEDPKWPKNEFLLRRGIIGSYKDEMPLDVLKAFLCDARGSLEKCGYL